MSASNLVASEHEITSGEQTPQYLLIKAQLRRVFKTAR
jgi:hypothetical protein